MTGPEHYVHAEQLLAGVTDKNVPAAIGSAIAAVAQVHATLALTAAYAADAIYRRDDRAAWDAALGRPADEEITR